MNKEEIVSGIESLPAIFSVHNVRSGRFLYLNWAVELILGYSPEEMTKEGFGYLLKLVHPDDTAMLTETYRKAIAKANQGKGMDTHQMMISLEYRIKHKNGSWKWLHSEGCVMRKNREQKVEEVMAVSLDITKRKEEEIKILEISSQLNRQLEAGVTELQNLKQALDQSAIVAITDKSGMIRYVNDKFVEISKYSRKELVGKTHRVINSGYHPKEFMKNLWDTILSGKVWRGQIRNRAKDGQYYWVDTTITPLLDRSGKPKQFIAIRFDITKRKELERQKDEFIGIVSHELRTPVTSMKGYVQILERQFRRRNDLASSEYMKKIDNQINKLTTLIQDLLDVTRIESGKMKMNMEQVNLKEVVKDVIDTLQVTTDTHRLVVEDIPDHYLLADKERISQVFTNLISNAIKYSPLSDKIIIRFKLDREKVIISVRDYGVGIPKNKQKQLFERFYRINGKAENTFPGLGLGLYISKEIVERHQGDIWVESEPGQGSEFYFSLPVSSDG